MSRARSVLTVVVLCCSLLPTVAAAGKLRIDVTNKTPFTLFTGELEANYPAQAKLCWGERQLEPNHTTTVTLDGVSPLDYSAQVRFEYEVREMQPPFMNSARFIASPAGTMRHGFTIKSVVGSGARFTGEDERPRNTPGLRVTQLSNHYNLVTRTRHIRYLVDLEPSYAATLSHGEVDPTWHGTRHERPSRPWPQVALVAHNADGVPPAEDSPICRRRGLIQKLPSY